MTIVLYVIMLVNHKKKNMAAQRPYKIIFCDDEREQCEQFQAAHDGADFAITTVTELDSLPQKYIFD